MSSSSFLKKKRCKFKREVPIPICSKSENVASFRFWKKTTSLKVVKHWNYQNEPLRNQGCTGICGFKHKNIHFALQFQLLTYRVNLSFRFWSLKIRFTDSNLKKNKLFPSIFYNITKTSSLKAVLEIYFGY